MIPLKFPEHPQAMPLAQWITQLRPEELAAALGGRFTSLVHLGAGGQASVFRGTGVLGAVQSREVAVKLYDPAGDQVRIDREVAALKGTMCPHLAEALDEGTITVGANTARWVAWRFVDGQSIRAKLAASGQLTHREVAKLVSDVSLAIDELWATRIVHRDIKPDNIILETATGKYVLVDLGLARFLNESSISQAGTACGTLGYMSPEQALGERRLTSLSDVFALGVTACEAIDGIHPTRGSQLALMPGSPNVANLLTSVPLSWMATLEPMLAHDPTARPTPQAIFRSLATHL